MKHTSHSRAVRFLSGLFYFFSIFMFINAFNFQHNPPSGWQQQFLPFLNNMPLSDMDFVDSLTGYGVTGVGASAETNGGDTNYIIKTTDGGDSWDIVFRVYRYLKKVTFLNPDTGFVLGAGNSIGGYLTKTTNGGLTWIDIPTQFGGAFNDMHVLNEDTIWISDNMGLIGGLWRTTDGGVSWLRQYGGITGNPDGIYMYNARLGFMSRLDKTILSRTTDGGFSWNDISGVLGFTDLHFSDSLNGWKADGHIEFTSDGGESWNRQSLPKTFIPAMSSLKVMSMDTIWGVGGGEFYPQANLVKAIIYKTTNGGSLWGYQLPDTSFGFRVLRQIDFANNMAGWAYLFKSGVHTTIGGDTNTIFTGIEYLSSPGMVRSFELLQNYPNPFNPSTRIRFILRERGFCRLAVYDITGREVRELISREYPAGEWQAEFDGTELPAGVYFARLEFTSDKGIAQSATRNMLLIK